MSIDSYSSTKQTQTTHKHHAAKNDVKKIDIFGYVDPAVVVHDEEDATNPPEISRRADRGVQRGRSGRAECADWARTGADCGWRAKARTRADSRGLARTGEHAAQATPSPLSGNRHITITKVVTLATKVTGGWCLT